MFPSKPHPQVPHPHAFGTPPGMVMLLLAITSCISQTYAYGKMIFGIASIASAQLPFIQNHLETMGPGPNYNLQKLQNYRQ